MKIDIPKIKKPINEEHQNLLNFSLLSSIELDDSKGVLSSIKSGADVNKQPNKNRLSPLIAAVNEGHNLIVKNLLNSGADVNAQIYLPIKNTNPVEYLSVNALMAAVENDDLDMVKFLLRKGANINDCDSAGFTPLMLSVNMENTDLFEYLLDKGADTNCVNRDKKTVMDLIKLNEANNFLAILEKTLLNRLVSENSHNDINKADLNKRIRL